MKRKNFTELTFKEIVNSILNESAEEIEEFAHETEETEETEDSFDVSDFEEEGAEEESTEGDKTVTLTLDEISVLRSILAKVDGVSEEEDAEEENAEEDDVEISEEEDMEDEEPADIPVPEEEETIVADGRGEAGVTINNKGVTRKKGTPAVDRSRSTKTGLMGNTAAVGDADVVELNAGVTRKKGAPAISRSGKHTGTRIAPGKATIEIGK